MPILSPSAPGLPPAIRRGQKAKPVERASSTLSAQTNEWMRRLTEGEPEHVGTDNKIFWSAQSSDLCSVGLQFDEFDERLPVTFQEPFSTSPEWSYDNLPYP